MRYFACVWLAEVEHVNMEQEVMFDEIRISNMNIDLSVHCCYCKTYSNATR